MPVSPAFRTALGLTLGLAAAFAPAARAGPHSGHLLPSLQPLPGASAQTGHVMTSVQPPAGASSMKARTVMKVIDSLDVEHHWPAGVHVNWQTGDPDDHPESGEGKHTHCSAFVAAAAKQLGVYILRPPEHGQVLLANAQYNWLSGDGAQQGWTQLPDAAAAQSYANRGFLVVAAYKSHKSDKPGHIAIVRPGDKPADQLQAEGPDITQAGETNYRVIDERTGFQGHPHAFADNEILYFAHDVP